VGLGSSPLNYSTLQPLAQFCSGHAATCHSQNNLLLFINRRAYFKTIEYQKHFNRGVAYTFIAVKEGMILNQGMS
jgi:hypothetical protein